MKNVGKIDISDNTEKIVEQNLKKLKKIWTNSQKTENFFWKYTKLTKMSEKLLTISTLFHKKFDIFDTFLSKIDNFDP